MGVEVGLLQPFWLALLPLPLLWLRWQRHRRGMSSVVSPSLAMRYPLLPVIHTDSGVPRMPGSATVEVMISMALLLVVIALAQPVRYTGSVATTADSEPVDLVVVAGTAISMTLRDYIVGGEPVDRMSITRRLLDGFVAGYRGRRIGLVVLGNPPALWLPLTTDRAVVRDAVSRLRPVLGGRLSDMGATLQLVEQRFREAGEKVVVLVTDGGLQLGATSPLAAARALGAAGNTLYVIGIGAGEPGAGGAEQGGLIYEPIDAVFLQALADAGGGAFFHAQDTDAFSAALSTIESRHRRPGTAIPVERLVEPWYPLPLGLAMALLLLSVWWPQLRGGRRAGADA